jgi:hypothetical protein
MFARGKHGFCGVFTVPRNHGFLKDLGEFHRKLPRALALALRAAPCKYRFLKDLRKLDCTPNVSMVF